jgi:hypothetical protein
VFANKISSFFSEEESKINENLNNLVLLKRKLSTEGKEIYENNNSSTNNTEIILQSLTKNEDETNEKIKMLNEQIYEMKKKINLVNSKLEKKN